MISVGGRFAAALAVTTLNGCGSLKDACSDFPKAGGRYPIFKLYGPQYFSSISRRTQYFRMDENNVIVYRAMEAVLMCYPRGPHKGFKDSVKYLDFVEARARRSGNIFLIYDFTNITDVRIVVEVDRGGKVLRVMTGNMLTG
jgi:hypothetical protein